MTSPHLQVLNLLVVPCQQHTTSANRSSLNQPSLLLHILSSFSLHPHLQVLDLLVVPCQCLRVRQRLSRKIHNLKSHVECKDIEQLTEEMAVVTATHQGGKAAVDEDVAGLQHRVEVAACGQQTLWVRREKQIECERLCVIISES